MNLVFISIIGASVLQVAILGFSFGLLFSIVGRILFLLRLLGSVVPVKLSMGLEVANLFIMCVVAIFQKSGHDWLGMLGNIVFCGIVILLYFIDNLFYLYVVEDDKEEEIIHETDKGRKPRKRK